MDLGRWARAQPEKAALIFPEAGQVVSYGELDASVDRVARWLVSLDLQPGDVLAYLLPNSVQVFEIAFAARRAGLYYTPLNTHLRDAELAYVLKDAGAKVLVAGAEYADLASRLAQPGLKIFIIGGGLGASDYEQAVEAAQAAAPPAERPSGRDFVYSSGTTGYPKGIRKPLTPVESAGEPDREVEAWRKSFQFGQDTIYLSPAPLYHASPLRYCVRTLQVGGTCVVLGKFEAEAALRSIETYKVTHSQWVPLMFIRLLALPQPVRQRHDLSSMRYAIHAAAPCPVSVKEQMIDWWGDRLWEFYGGSEGIGTTMIGPVDWKTHKGSVGKAVLGEVRIVGEAGSVVEPGQIGKIFFAGGPTFEYYNDPEKTRAAYNEAGWATYGDIGHLDAEGYLYLSGRRTDLIISGGVNIYPQEIEDCLSRHEAVFDVAVIGVPNTEFGEEVKAVVQLRNHADASEALAVELMAYCRSALSPVKTPRSVDFDAALPRQENGKLLKRLIKERFWPRVADGGAPS